jgi:2'-5' RNA ligase
MPKERLKSPRARLFVALDLPEEVRDAVIAWQGGFDDPGLRPIEPAQLHLTLVFLGYQPEREIDRIASLALDARGIRAPTVELEPDPVSVPRARPRLFALDAKAEGVKALQAGVSDRLEAARLYKPEKRPFWPHLTVARVRPERRGARRPARILNPPEPLPNALLEPFFCRRIRLYRSYLRPQGAEYVPMAEIELPAD